MKERKAGVAIGGWDWAEPTVEVVGGLEIGRIGGEADDIFRSRERERAERLKFEYRGKSIKRERETERLNGVRFECSDLQNWKNKYSFFQETITNI